MENVVKHEEVLEAEEPATLTRMFFEVRAKALHYVQVARSPAETLE